MTTTKSTATICSFPNVSPVNTAEEGIRLGHYNDHYDYITDKTVPLTSVEGKKNLHVVCFNRTVGETEWVELLRAEGKQPCRHAPQYLLGLMVQVPEDQMPAELRNKDIVAEEQESSSVFTDESGDRGFLGVRRDGGNRELILTRVDGRWFDDDAFLAEDLVA